MKNLINQIILEGPDLSGKTTLYENIHNMTQYRWNIQDRSSLSMLVYAKLYGRDEFPHVEALNTELNNLNNFMILLLPEWKVISERFSKRGDPIQNLSSLKRLYDIFSEAADEFEHLPNVFVLRKEVNDFIIKEVLQSLVKFEYLNFSDLHAYAINSCLTTKSFEKIGLTFTSYDNGNFNDINYEDLNYEKEKEYYEHLKKDMILKLKNEFAGINTTNIKQDINSRRFIYTSDSCISLAHFLFRDNILDCKYFLRSSNTKDILKYDLNFLKYLTKCVYDFLNLENIKTRIKVTINSAHIPNIIN